MKKLYNTFDAQKKLIRNPKGQVAIFVALIFQVLFVFFAMIVNVGLVVHHKINLQNSVDLAAYYGATKQAEMLNAIGHVNYQIRQAYKLMTFRYRQLGGAGAVRQNPPGHPFNGTNILRENDATPPYEPTFCILYTPFDLVTPSESYCQQAAPVGIPLPGVPNLAQGFGLGPFLGFQNEIRKAAISFRNSARASCSFYMGQNWIQMGKFIFAYKMDIRNRRKLILGLANEISQKVPNDIKGESIKEGVFHTLMNNLSIPNKESMEQAYQDNGDGSATKEVEFKYINSLSEGRCQGNPSESQAPGWLKEIYVVPTYSVTDGNCTGQFSLEIAPSYFNTGPVITPSPNVPAAQAQFAHQLAEVAGERGFQPGDMRLLYRTMTGYEKDPWCVAYTGVSATTTPKIPFSPVGEVTIKARAFAKPFGGRIGPWYGTQWPHGSPKSSDNPRTDTLLPKRVEGDFQPVYQNPTPFLNANRLYINHSRYLGDTVGVNSDLTLSQFGRAIHQTKFPAQINLDWWDHIFDQDFDLKNANGDVLAWDREINQAPPRLREIEIAAVAPDQFDTATYSIDPDFYNNYLTKIEKGYGSKFQFLLRGDLGSRMLGTPAERRFSVRNQIETLANSTLIDHTGKLSYYLNAFGQLLTSWQQKTPDNYVGVDDTRFGKCLDGSGDEVKQDGDEHFFTMGSCRSGGRTGYSVKLVDGKFLQNVVNGSQQPFELGGKTIFGTIDNPPPSGF